MNFLNKIRPKNLVKLSKTYITSKIEIPSEFCDPLLYTIIKKPVILPNSDILMDESSIKKHLENDTINPFSRETLTHDELDKFNQDPKIIIKLKEFIQKRDKWLSDNNISM